MSELTNIQTLLSEFPEGKIILDRPVKVKSGPHQHVFTIYGAWGGEQGVWLMDGAGEWHGPLEESQINANFIINSLYQRLKYIIHAGAASN